MARRIINFDHFRAFSLGNAELEREVFGLFLADLPETFEAARAARLEKDWRALLHRMRGSAMGVGAERLTDAARAAEGLAFTDAPGRNAALDQIRAEIDAVVAAARDCGLAERP